MEAVRLFRDRREMCEENKRKKKKNEGFTTRPAQKKWTQAAFNSRGLSPAQKKTQKNVYKTWLQSWAKAPREKPGWKLTL